MREMRETNNTALLGPVWLNGFLDGLSTQAELFKRYVCVFALIYMRVPLYILQLLGFSIFRINQARIGRVKCHRALHVASGSDAVNGSAQVNGGHYLLR